MNDTELRKTAERLAGFVPGRMIVVGGSGAGQEYPNPLVGAPELAKAWLAEHPADDAEPLTAEWLKSVGFTDRGERPGRSMAIHHFPPTGEYMLTFKWIGATMILAYVFDSMVAESKRDWTRGDARRLCAALGIGLKGAK